MRLFGGVLFLAATASLLPAGIVNYNGDIMPAAYPFPSQVFGADALMTTDTHVLEMVTAPHEGVWFGAASGMADSGSGNYVSLDARVSVDATDWYLYFGDGANFAEFKLNAGSFYYQTATEIAGPVAMDLTSSYHNFSIWMRTGIVTYAVDNTVVYSGAAVHYDGTPILVGDPSGADLGTTGSMFVDRLAIVNGADFASAPAIPDSPEPSTWMLCGAAMAVAGYKRLRSR